LLLFDDDDDDDDAVVVDETEDAEDIKLNFLRTYLIKIYRNFFNNCQQKAMSIERSLIYYYIRNLPSALIIDKNSFFVLMFSLNIPSTADVVNSAVVD